MPYLKLSDACLAYGHVPLLDHADFLLDPATQAVIGEFGIERFGQSLFTPCADNSCGVVPMATPVP